MGNQGAVSEAKCSYDVFLSFRGEDTRLTFTTDLYNALDEKRIITFMDNEELKAGERIGPTLEKAIEESRSSIVVFSQNYADSAWCLQELVKIHECKLKNDQIVIPIFYKVEPSDVRDQKGTYGAAMAKHERRYSKDVPTWKSTLFEIASLSGKPLIGDKSKCIQELVSEIFIRVSPKDLTRNEHIVGREDRVEELKSRLQIESRNITCMLGIHGAPGIGKTTLAKALYDSVYKKFEGSCFLSDVKETSKETSKQSEGLEGLRLLQQRLLSEILEDKKFKLTGNEEISTIKFRLGLKRVLIVLDNVDDIEQLNNLAGERDWFGLGSRIIITTRDKHLLDLANVENENRYEVNVLNDQESLDLICHTAFQKSCPEPNYEDLAYRAMRCCEGIPSALKGLGFHLRGKDLEGWEDAVDRYEKSPHPEVQKAFGISDASLPVSCRSPLSYQF